MNQELYTIIQSMQNYMYNQDKTIKSLQKKVKQLEKTVLDIQSRPPVNVEKLEYKFDQLKVETLEGTLNIGLNPSDLQGIDDLSVANKPVIPSDRQSLANEIENHIRQYLDQNLQTILEDSGKQLQLNVNDSYRDFILQDITKQLPNRIEYYLNQPLRSENETPEQQKARIFEQMKKEIHNGIITFLQHLPENMKGTKKE